MKTLILAIVLLLSIIVVTVSGALYTDKKLEEFSQKIERSIPKESSDTVNIHKGALQIEKEYDRLKKCLILFIPDNGVNEIEEHIEDIKSASASGELVDAMMSKSRLILHIQQLRRLSKFSTEVIF